ncbi:hypothetical protein EJ05DRAFT_496868 [Pseudovirgaria hyperparasitica]|uniref:Uncharacterized protein n=1 Tax=Pseudovirgaria hyperparasitica TaxID=470096 RepID=A0A6A6WJJ9_9PEZI|nr:uncharacterized protein EJ05DRAFT_496868 [Pseudovirgaria hyperparasitica]KAF2761987.1 hypothetical protein EJ05DRAFT_496868 [Pseudovirgaria hyperparasitica]
MADRAEEWKTKLIGKKLGDNHDDSTFSKTDLPEGHRVLEENEPTTKEFFVDRLNVVKDKEGVVSRSPTSAKLGPAGSPIKDLIPYMPTEEYFQELFDGARWMRNSNERTEHNDNCPTDKVDDSSWLLKSFDKNETPPTGADNSDHPVSSESQNNVRDGRRALVGMMDEAQVLLRQFYNSETRVPEKKELPTLKDDTSTEDGMKAWVKLLEDQQAELEENLMSLEGHKRVDGFIEQRAKSSSFTGLPPHPQQDPRERSRQLARRMRCFIDRTRGALKVLRSRIRSMRKVRKEPPTGPRSWDDPRDHEEECLDDKMDRMNDWSSRFEHGRLVRGRGPPYGKRGYGRL